METDKLVDSYDHGKPLCGFYILVTADEFTEVENVAETPFSRARVPSDHQTVEENMEETNEEDGSFSHYLNDDPLEFESQGCHKMCRLCACLVQEMKVINMFTDSEKNLVVKINRFLVDKVSPDDGLPPDVCKSCVAKLNYCNKTISSFITADRKLRDLFEVDEKSKILVEIPVIDKEQENESQEFETLHVEKYAASIGDETNDSFTRECDEQKCTPLVTGCDDDYPPSETKFISLDSSSQCEVYSSEYLNKHADGLVDQETNIKNEIYIEQICDENLFNADDYGEDSNPSVDTYNGCNDDDTSFELGKEDGDEYFSEETAQVDEVLEEVYVEDEVEDFLNLQSLQNQHRVINVVSSDLSSEVCEVAEKETFFNSSVQKQFETQFENIPVLCDLCGKTFPDIYRLKCHKTMHSSDRARVCSICGKVFKNYYNMRRHMIIHTEKNFTCATCGRAFYSKTLLAQHMLSHSRERPFKCDICGVAYNRHSNMLQHRKLAHANINSGEGAQSLAYQCNKCGRRLRSELTFKAHLAKHNGGISFFQCETCGKQYKTIELYRVHLRVHTGERPYMCEVCGKSFRGAYTLKQHSWQHREDCRYSCPYCGRQFKQMYTLIVHKRIHTGEKPYACPICGRCFSQKNDMKKHTRTHDSKETKQSISNDVLFLS